MEPRSKTPRQDETNTRSKQDNAQQLPRSGSNRCVVVVAVVPEDVVMFILVVVVAVAVF